MSVFASLGILVLAMLIMAFLELTPGVFLLFSHYNAGKFSKRKASDLSMFFILGAETIAACLFLSIFFLVAVLSLGQIYLDHNIISYIAAGICFAYAIVIFFFYYRRGNGTRLFISRNFARGLNENAKSIKTRSDAFTLGALSGTSELIFTLPLYVITSMEIMQTEMDFLPDLLFTVIYILAPVVPLFIIRWRFHTSHNLAELQRSRVKNKSFVRFLLGFSYLTIAILIICFRAI